MPDNVYSDASISHCLHQNVSECVIEMLNVSVEKTKDNKNWRKEIYFIIKIIFIL